MKVSRWPNSSTKDPAYLLGFVVVVLFVLFFVLFFPLSRGGGKHTEKENLKATNTEQRLQILNNKYPGQIAEASVCIRLRLSSVCVE